MRLFVPLVMVTALFAGCADPEGPAPTQPLPLDASPSALRLDMAFDGFTRPVLLTHAADGTNRTFVLEQDGRVILLRDGVRQDVPFLDLREHVASGGERGLLGMAFPSDHMATGRFYVSYTDKNGDSILARHRAAADADTAEPEGEIILRVEQPYANHNGGHIVFGPDTYLYYGLGDGGAAGDPQGNGQDPHALLGSILRLDVSSDAGYAIPPDNPYVPGGGAPEVWAKGLRNPWRFSFDTNGDLFIGDVGQGKWEEIDLLPAGVGGLNFGWNTYEGAHRYGIGGTTFSDATNPIAEYPHENGACSVTAGFMLRGPQAGAYDGTFLFGDYCNGLLFGLTKANDTWASRTLLETGLQIASFGQDGAGDTYVIHHGGSIHRIVVSTL